LYVPCECCFRFLSSEKSARQIRARPMPDFEKLHEKWGQTMELRKQGSFKPTVVGNGFRYKSISVICFFFYNSGCVTSKNSEVLHTWHKFMVTENALNIWKTWSFLRSVHAVFGLYFMVNCDRLCLQYCLQWNNGL